MSQVIVQPVNQDAVDVLDAPKVVVVVEKQPPQKIDVIARGPQGVSGPPGNGSGDATSILGFPVRLSDGQPEDLLEFTGSEWVNKPQNDVTDGGNF